MKYKYILFDLDGTLIDTNKLIIDSFKHTYKLHLNVDISEEEILRHFGEPLIITLRRYSASEEEAQEMFKTYIEYNEAKHDSVVMLCSGIHECLAALKNLGCTLAVVTSKRKKIALQGLALFDLLKYFDVVVALEDTNSHKPNPEPILKALELLAAETEEAIMVGDSVFDILCAKNAGVRSILVKWSAAHGHQGDEVIADYIVHEVCDLIDIVK